MNASAARRPLLALAVAACTAFLLASAATASARPSGAGKGKQPNILVVMTDDMAQTDLQFMPSVRRKLAQKGTKFTNAIDAFPLCCPARATFITGQYSHNHGVIGNFAPYGWYGMKHRGDTLPVWLDDAGYRTAALGKWLNGYGALDAHGEIPKGFDTWRGLLDVSAYDYYNFVMNKDGKLKTWGDEEFAKKLVEFAYIEVDDEPDTLGTIFAELADLFGPPPYDYWGSQKPRDYSPDVTGKMATRLVRGERNAKKPFFIWWSPAAPHREDVSTTLMGRPGPDPRSAPRYVDESEQLTLPQGPSFNNPGTGPQPANMAAAGPLDQEDIDQLNLDYQGRAGSIMAVDDHVKEMIKTLRETHQLKNTVIMFLSDNGWLQGEHRVPGDKYLPYDESLKVPLIIRGPGIPKGEKVTGQISNVDFAPTLLDFANAAAGRTMDGVSLIPTMKDPAKLPDRALGIEAPAPLFAGAIPVNGWDRPYEGVRTDRYTFVEYTETGDRQLFDRQSDPHELDNLAGDPTYADVEQRLAEKTQELSECAGKACTKIKP
ncbi:MAG: sulfatase [Solirubrobacterales bacterium]|nr:sulfatase [Solirubrobacterales bacterium]